MIIWVIASIIWLQVAYFYDYLLTYPIWISLACNLIALGCAIYKIIRRYKNGKI